jgi:hypothetical protein
MTRFHRWKAGTVGFVAMVVTTSAITPMFTPVPASAQVFRNRREYPNEYGNPSGQVSIPRGVTIPVTYEKDKVVVTPKETAPLKLKVQSNVVDRNGYVLIPEGTEIVGQLEPATRNREEGSRFIAQELVFPNGNRQYIDATSQVVTNKQKVTKGANTGTIVKDAALGAGAASVIALITGDRSIQALEPIGGAAAGALASVLLRKRETEVIVIEPDRDLDITLRSNLVLSRGY